MPQHRPRPAPGTTRGTREDESQDHAVRGCRLQEEEEKEEEEEEEEQLVEEQEEEEEQEGKEEQE